MPLFGTIILWIALTAIVASVGLYLAANAARRNPTLADRLMMVGRGTFILAALSIFAAAVTLGTLLVTHRFDVLYVYQHSARAMAPLYWLPSFWSGQEGSFLLWAFWTSVLGLVLVATSGKAERRVMPIFGMMLIFLTVLLNIKSPFVMTTDSLGMLVTPPEGLGLNPNLENPWMVIHPPTLFLGFSSLLVPFAFAVSALFWRAEIQQGENGWLRRALPWGLFGFAVLGLAMMMGGYWAYEMLGWGGFWEWDPVENGPFIPWISLVAFLHAAQIQRVRGGFGKPTLFFALLPFIGAMYESFMTRSGVLTNFSVHSFSELGGISNDLLLGALLGIILLSLGMLIWRRKEISATETKTDSVWDDPKAREYGFTLAIVLLTLCAVIAAVGMSAPLLTSLGIKLHLAKYSASVSEDYHNKAMFPLAVLLAIGLGTGPHLAWRGRGGPDSKRLVTAYALSVVAALGFILLAHWLGTGLNGAHLVPQLILFTASIFAIISNIMLLMPRKPYPLPVGEGRAERGEGFVRRSFWTIGGVLSHLGAATLLVGIVCLVTFVRKEPDVLLVKNLPQSVLGGEYMMTYKGQTSDYQTDKNNALLFTVVSRDGKEKFTAHLPFALRAVEGGDKKLFGHPAIVHHAGGDLYIALKDGPDQFYPRGRFVEAVKLGDTKTFGPYAIHFDKFERDPQAAALAMSGQMPARFPVWADLDVTYQGKTVHLKPQSIMLRDTPGAPESPEIALPGGWLLAFASMNAGSADPNNPNAGATNEAGSFVIRPNGPVLEGFQLEVTTRPMISLVWIGTLLIFFGGLVGMGHRIRENRALPISDLPEPTPRPSRRDSLPLTGGGSGRGSSRRAKGRTAGAGKPAPSLTAAGRSTRSGG